MNIQILDENRYYVENRGQKLTVIKNPHSMMYAWTVLVENASVRTWRNGFCSKWFHTLEDVEAKYKSLKGIAQLHASLQEAEALPVQ